MTAFPSRTALGRFVIGGAWMAWAVIGAALAQPPVNETVVLIRHGEKPPAGLGQLSCQGLNRALALGGVLKQAFGKPDALFAPDPAIRKTDHGTPYDYVRPLATIEPAAIAMGLPVDTSIGFADIAALRTALEAQHLRQALVVVAWEHTELVALARLRLAAHGADPALVPAWDQGDYDGMDVVRITRDGTKSNATFERRREGLDGQSSSCPR